VFSYRGILKRLFYDRACMFKFYNWLYILWVTLPHYHVARLPDRNKQWTETGYSLSDDQTEHYNRRAQRRENFNYLMLPGTVRTERTELSVRFSCSQYRTQIKCSVLSTHSQRIEVSLLQTASWATHRRINVLNPLRQSGKYMNHLLWQSIMLHFVFIGFVRFSM
jgi:hypothetical protein